MATTKNSVKSKTTNSATNSATNPVTTEPTESTATTETVTSNTNNMDQITQMFAQMQEKLELLTSELLTTKQELSSTKQELEDTKSELANTTPVAIEAVELSEGSSVAEKYLEQIANRKADREVTIVHNCEIVGGGTTHIQLSNISIDFRRLGEKRILSWSQFEECASKYAGFFKREVILVDEENRDVAELYQLPCVKRSDGEVLTRSQLEKMGTMNVTQLTNLYNSLTKRDKEFMLSYWLGQCYNRVPGFYDRHKIETLNGLSGTSAFETFLAFMNGDIINNSRPTSTTQNTQNAQSDMIIGRV